MMGGGGGIRRSKKGEFFVLFHFSRRTCMTHLFHAGSPDVGLRMGAVVEDCAAPAVSVVADMLGTSLAG